jgi:hypothetical protein
MVPSQLEKPLPPLTFVYRRMLGVSIDVFVI